MSDVKLYLGDCLDILPTLAAGSVDAIITDIPYGTTACSWDEVIPFAPMWREIKRLLKPRGVFVTTANQPFTSRLIMSNLAWFKHEWIWEKTRGSGFLSVNLRPLNTHDNILVFGSGMLKYYPQKEHGESYAINSAPTKTPEHYSAHVAKRGEWDGERFPRSVLRISSGQNGNKDHPTQKPVALYSYLIRTYTNEGDTVLDFCMGSGTTGVACVNTGRDFIGIELKEEYYAIAEKRIAEARLQIRMPI